MTDPVDGFIENCLSRFNPLLENCLPGILPGTLPDASQTDLFNAVRYAVLGGGKRIRPCLVYAGAAAVGAISESVDRAACAVELMHTYSLIHDDLPAMDDDDLRRGKPTCHKAFGEATAILVGDGLQTLAFEQLSLINGLPAVTVLAMVGELSRAAGLGGMILGQAMDLAATGKDITRDYLQTMHQRKTGDLIAASIVLGAMSGGCTDEDSLDYLRRYGQAIGLIFQIVDDILDATGDTAALGKTAGADNRLGKSTYLSTMTPATARAEAESLFTQSLSLLAPLGAEANPLRQLGRYMLQRAK